MDINYINMDTLQITDASGNKTSFYSQAYINSQVELAVNNAYATFKENFSITPEQEALVTGQTVQDQEAALGAGGVAPSA
jgi:hypothetical protein